MPKLVLTMVNGERLDTSFMPPYTLKEQIGFEDHFGLSFQAVETAHGEMVKAAREEPVDFSRSLRTKWILWFGWRRLRPKVPAKFDTFVEMIDDWEVSLTDEEMATVAEAQARAAEPEDGHSPAELVAVGAEDEGVDPTVTEAASVQGV